MTSCAASSTKGHERAHASDERFEAVGTTKTLSSGDSGRVRVVILSPFLAVAAAQHEVWRRKSCL